MSNQNSIKQIKDLEAGKWVTLEVKVEQIWESNHEAIRQTGIMTDETGIIKFVSWEKSNLPMLKEGETYRIGTVPVSEYDDHIQISLVKTTKIKQKRTTCCIIEDSELPLV